MSLDHEDLTPEDGIKGEDPEETALLRGMLAEAKGYLLGFDWCTRVDCAYMGVAVGGVVATFLLRAAMAQEQGEEWLWVVVGDVPSAYLVPDQVRAPTDVLRIYCSLMSEWVRAVQNSVDLSNAFPVDAPADSEHAQMLESRIKMLRDEVIPALE